MKRSASPRGTSRGLVGQSDQLFLHLPHGGRHSALGDDDDEIKPLWKRGLVEAIGLAKQTLPAIASYSVADFLAHRQAHATETQMIFKGIDGHHRTGLATAATLHPEKLGTHAETFNLSKSSIERGGVREGRAHGEFRP